ncbi:tetratricopeptide repeat protein [bacterium]|nr:tetratricopeptide repeat protein [bacterium]
MNRTSPVFKSKQKSGITLVLSLATFSLAAVLPIVGLSGCGSGNVFSGVVKRSDSDKAQAALESGDFDSAIDSLNSYLKDHPDDASARSMLANAYLKKSGVDLLKIGTSISSGTQGQSNWSTISGALPAGTSENVANVEAAVAALSSIPASQRTDEQNYQLAVAQTTLAVTVAKKVAGDGTGQLTTEKIDQMSDTDALTIYNALKGSKDATGAMTTPDSSLSKVGSITDGIDSQSGTTDADRLRNYLKTQS